MATFDEILERESNTLNENSFASALERQTTNNTFANLAEKKRAELGFKVEEKQVEVNELTNDFTNRTISLENGFDADTLFDLGRLSSAPGFSYDAYETAKYDENNELIPYLGSVDPTDGSKKSKKWRLHRQAYSKKYGIDYYKVTQEMLNLEASVQADAFKTALYKGQDPDSKNVSVDIRKDGEGFFGRNLITVRNPVTGEIINEILNTPENNALYFSNYNSAAWQEGVAELTSLERQEVTDAGEGFWSSAEKGLSSGLDGLQATGYGFAALIADAIPGTRGENTANWFLKQYLRNIEEAQTNGARLPGVEDVDWSNPTAVLSKLGSLIGEAMPSIALMLGTGGLGGLIAKQAIKSGIKKKIGDKVGDEAKKIIAKVTNIGRTAGAYTGSNVMMTGGIYGDVASEGNRDATAMLGSLAGGSIAAGLEIIYPLKLLNKFGMGKAATNTVRKSLQKNSLGTNLGNIGKEILSGGLTEGTTEALQFYIEETTQTLIKEGHLPDYKSKEFQLGVLNSFVAGLVPGSAFSGSASLASAGANFVQGDATALQNDLNTVKQEAQQAKDTYVAGTGTIESQEQLAIERRLVERELEALGVTLPEGYQENSEVGKAAIISDALNRIELKEKGNVNPAVTTAKNTIDKAIANLNTGSAKDIVETQINTINNRTTAEIDAIEEQVEIDSKALTPAGRAKSPKAIAKIRQKADKQIKTINSSAKAAIQPILDKNTAGEKEGVKVISRAVSNSIQRVNEINKVLNTSNVSKRQTKKLKSERNQLGKKIQSLKISGNSGANGATLSKAANKNIDKALASFNFKNKIVESKNAVNTATVLSKAKIITEKIIQAQKDNKPQKELDALESELIDVYEEVANDRNNLIKDIAETNDPVKSAELKNRLLEVEKYLQTIVKDITAIQDAKKAKPKTKPKAETAKPKVKKVKPKTETTTEEVVQPKDVSLDDILNSLDVTSINQGVNEDILNSSDKKLTAKQKVNITARKALKTINDATVELIKGNSFLKKSMQKVHQEILNGTKQYKGLNFYLKQAQTNREGFDDIAFENFIDGLIRKEIAFSKAKEIFDITGEVTYIDTKTYEVFNSEEDLPANAIKDVNSTYGYKNYWFVVASSATLIELNKQEVAYAEQIKVLIQNVIGTEKSRTTKKEEVLKREERNKKLEDIAKKSEETTGSLDDVVNAQETEPKTVEEEDIIIEAAEKTETKSKNRKYPKNTRLRNYVIQVYSVIDLTDVKIKEIIIKVNAAKANSNEEMQLKGELEALRLRKAALKEELATYLKEKSAVKLANHFLTKFKNVFNKFKDSDLKVGDLFRINNLDRDSFFTSNEETELTPDVIRKKLKALKIDNSVYIETVVDNFVEFKDNFNKHVNRKLSKKQKKEGIFLDDPEAVFLDANGNMPDEVIFAMMLSTMHWAAINEKTSKNKPRYVMALLLYGDAKQTNRLTQEQIQIFSNAGIFAKDAAKDIGTEILDLLNIRIDKPGEKELLLNLTKAKGENNSEFQKILIKDARQGPRIASGLGLLALETARFMHDNNASTLKTPKGGAIVLLKSTYEKSLFADNENLGILSEDNKSYIEWNSFVIRESEQLQIFKDNAENLKLIKGDETTLRDTYDNPVTEIQEKTDDSFFNLNEKVKRIIGKLQNVAWVGKQEELELFEKIIEVDDKGKVIETVTLNALIGIKDLNKQHDTNIAAIESGNREKLDDVQHVYDYIQKSKKAKGLKKFYFRYKAQSQHRLRIDSNTINGQRSKIHRALFNPFGSESKIGINSKKSSEDRDVFKLAVVQAFGYNIKTLEEGRATFDKLYANKEVKDVINVLNDKAALNEALNNLMEAKDANNESIVSPSTHLIEGLIALSKYDADNEFTTSLGIETDGTTNGYAIGLLQFLDGTPEELKEALKRVGIFVDQKDLVNTYEKFVADKKNDDTYQVFARRILNGLNNPENKFTNAQKNVVKVLHGEFEIEGALTKFARDLAKDPVMISNYGAGLAKVITNIISKIVPNFYNDLAKLQNEFDNAINKQEQDVVVAKVKNLEVTLKSMGIIVELRKHLNNKKFTPATDTTPLIRENLYGFELESNQKTKFEKYFNNIYANKKSKLFENALQEIIKLIDPSREIIIRVVEAEYFMFKVAFDKRTEGIALTGQNAISMRQHIAAELADKFMPRMNSPWSNLENENALIQLIKYSTVKESRVEVKTKDLKAFTYKKADKKFKKISKLTPYGSIGVNTSRGKIVSPGVSAAINMVQNMDSVVLGDLLDQKQQVLPIYDAVISPIKDALKNAGLYNAAFLKNNLNHVFLEQTLKQFDNVLKAFEAEGLSKIEVNKALREQSYEARLILDNNADISKEDDAKLKQMNLTNVRKDLQNKVITRQKNLRKLIETFGASSTWVVSQMPMPESIQNRELTPESTENSNEGSEVTEKLAEVETEAEVEVDADVNRDTVSFEDFQKEQAKIDENRGDPENANNQIQFTWKQFISELTKSELKVINEQNLVENYTDKEILEFINDSSKVNKAIEESNPGIEEDGPDLEARANFQFLNSLALISLGLNDNLFSIDNVVATELKQIYKTNSLRENLQSIFNTLGLVSKGSYLNSSDQTNQQNHLQRLMDEIISKAGSLLDETTVTLNSSNVKAHGEANIRERSINVNFNKYAPDTYSEQTSQEVYLHELLHVLTRFALKKDSRLKEKLERIRNQVIKELENSEANPYEIFLHKDSDGNIIYKTDKEAEIEAAKAQYNYLFGDRVPANAVIDEFLAYSMTNPFLVKKLQGMQSETVPFWSKEESDTITEKLVKFFTEVVEAVGRALSGKTKPLNVEQEIFELTKDVVAVNQSKRDELTRALKLDKVGSAIDKGNERAAQLIQDLASGAIKRGSDAYIAAVDRITDNGKVNNFLADVLYDTKLVAYLGSSYKDFVDDHPKVQEKLNVIYRNFKPNSLKNLSSLKADLFGGVDQDFIRLLYKSHKEVDSNRKNYKELTKKQMQRMFKDYDSLTFSEKESLTKVFLKTDLALLVSSGEFTVEQTVELIKDEQKLKKVLSDYRKKVGVDKNTDWAKKLDSQSNQLANIMITGKGYGPNQWLNAHNIFKKSKKKSKNEESDIKDLDIYITLLALSKNDLSHAKKDVNTVVEREFNFDKDSATHNGIFGLINLHIAFKEKSQNEGFLDSTGNPNPAFITKGYIATITDPDAELIVEPDDKATRKEMKRLGYTFISKISLASGGKPYALYVIKNNPEQPRTKGIVSMTSKQFKGTSLKQIIGRNQDKAGMIMKTLEKFKEKETERAESNTVSGLPAMIPVPDENLNISDYRIQLSHSATEKYLDQDLAFDEVLPTMYSHLEDKIKSEEINREAIKLLYDYGKENQSKNPSKFINILDSKYIDEYYLPLPKQAKFDLEYFARTNKKTGKQEFWVERGVLDTVFGYKNPSFSNVGLFKSLPKTQRYIRIGEKLVKEMVSLAVVNVVIKIPIVPAVNFASNFVTSALYGVPPTYLFKKWREGIVELNKYRKDVETLKLLDIEMLSNPSMQNNTSVDKKRAILVNKINNNTVSKLVDKGLFNSITEDINQNEFTYRNKTFNKIKNVGNKLVTGKVFDVANHAYLGEHTAVFKASMHFLQISDFVARYALYSYQTEVKKIPEEKAWKTMVETFVNYDQPLNRYVAYGNDMGAILFVKYWLRIQRAGINLIKEKPLNAGMLFVGNSLLGLDIETILDSNLITGNFMPTLGGFEKIFEEILIPPGVEIIMGEGFG